MTLNTSTILSSPKRSLRFGPSIPSFSQEIKIMEDGKVYIKASVSDTAQLRWWLLGFGGQVEVISPKSLREELFKSAKDMIKVYR